MLSDHENENSDLNLVYDSMKQIISIFEKKSMHFEAIKKGEWIVTAPCKIQKNAICLSKKENDITICELSCASNHCMRLIIIYKYKVKQFVIAYIYVLLMKMN